MAMGAFVGLAFGRLGTGLAGFFFGLIMGPIYVYRERKDPHSWLFPDSDETLEDYPEELERVERRHAGQDLILIPLFMITGIAVSWIIFDTGWYGGLGGFLGTVVTSWALGRFGGPNDPKWNKVRSEWRRQHTGADRAGR